MDHHQYDKSSKWLIQKHGNGILYLGGIRHVRAWRALQAELVQPSQLPDGLLEVFFHGRSTPDYFLLEVATYPENRRAGTSGGARQPVSRIASARAITL